MTSAVETRKKWAMALVAFLATFGLFAATAVEKAGATVVQPSAATTFTQASATLDPTQFSWFVPNNAYFPLAVGCIEATADFEIPPSDLDPANRLFDLNENKRNVGTYSDDSGGVIGNMEPPTFDECGIYNLNTVPGTTAQEYHPPGQGTPNPTFALGASAIANAKESYGWTVSVDSIDSDEARASIAVPPLGVQVTISSGSPPCQLDIAVGKAQSVFADFYNGTDNDSRLEVDSQVKFVQKPDTTACSGLAALGLALTGPTGKDDAIAQYEADYIVTSGSGTVTVTP